MRYLKTNAVGIYMDTQAKELLRNRDFRDLQAIAKVCKSAKLCGAYSKLKKAALIEFLAAIPIEHLKPHLTLSWRQWFAVRWRELGGAAAIGVLGLIASLGGWMFPRSTANEDMAAAQKKSTEALLQQSVIETKQIEEIKALRLELVRRLEQIDRFAAGIAEVVGTMPLRSQEMQRSAQKLSELLSTFRAAHAGEKLLPQTESELRQAEATIHLANSRFKEAAEILSGPVFDQIARRAETSEREALSAGAVRGLALEGLGQWDDAIEVYTRVSRLDSIGAIQLRVAFCMFSSGRSTAAITILDDMVSRFDATIDRSDATKQLEASAYRLRGVMHGSLGRIDNAIQDLNNAIGLLNETDGDPKSLIATLIDLAIYSYDRNRAESDIAFARAEDLVKRQNVDDDDAMGELSRLRNHRAKQLLDEGRLEDAITLARSVVGMRRDALARHENLVTQQRLAESLNNLGAICGSGNDPKLALDPLSEAIVILSQLVEIKAQHDSIPEYTRALTNRADVLSKAGRAKAACEDARAAVNLARSLVAFTKHRNNLATTQCLAQSLRAYGASLERIGQNDDALLRLDESIEMFKGLEKANFPGARLDNASSLGQRGQLFMTMGRVADASKEFREVIDKCDRIEKDHLSLDGEVLRMIARHKLATCFQEMGQHAEAAAMYQSVLDSRKATFSQQPLAKRWSVLTKASLTLLLCSSSTLHDSKTALRLGREAVSELDTEWAAHHALAAAYAENGDFEMAVKTEVRALPNCPAGFKSLANESLAGYKDHKTLRQQFSMAKE